MSRAVVLPAMTEAEWREAKSRTDQEWARIPLQGGVLPDGWRERQLTKSDPLYGIRLANRGPQSLIFSAGCHDGQWWLHVSIAHPSILPTYEDLCAMKRLFIGRERQALQVFPAEDQHVNIHSKALHLWASLEPEGDGLPRFGRYGTI